MHKHTQREKEIRIYEVRQDAYVPGAEEGDLYTIYKELQEDYNVLQRTHSILTLNPSN